MAIDNFLEHHQVVRSIDEIHKLKRENNICVSDLIDDEGFQYVDFVCEGGGVLGIALAGYTYALEQAGIRFRHLGGTSAGAINVMLLAAAGAKNELKTQKLVEELSEKNLFDLVDGDSDAVDFVKSLTAKKRGIGKLFWKGAQVIDNLRDDLGLNPGDDFFQWITSMLEKEGVHTTADLERMLNFSPNGLGEKGKAKLKIVASDISTETKAVFPEMADLYWSDPGKLNPATYVRASMSIPGFFVPLQVNKIPQGKDSILLWQRKVSYRGKLPKKVFFVDGGMMSNFPISLFHTTNKTPVAPTFGVKLSMMRGEVQEITGPLSLAGAIVNAARHNADYEFITRNRDYEKLVCTIPSDGHDWLNFNMEIQEQVELFSKGVVSACNFLKKFDWEAYKKIRAS